MNVIDKKKRLVFYTFWEKDGIVRNYVAFYLQALKEVADTVVCIANGGMRDQDRKRLEAIGVEVKIRANEGIDFGAWQDAILERGWPDIHSYDELILCNCSCYGPVYPFSEVFGHMESKVCDFWGLTYHAERRDLRIIASDPESTIAEHLQSYFLVFRKSAIINEAFVKWWHEMEPARTRCEEIAHHEVKFTKYLSEVGGLKYCSYADVAKYNWLSNMGDPSTLCPMDLLSDRIPLVKRTLFFDTWPWLMLFSSGHEPREVLDYIAAHTHYSVDFIWEDLLATKKMSSIKDALHLNYILPSQTALADNRKDGSDVACICYGYYPDLAHKMCGYLKSMPENASIYIISSREDTLNAYRDELKACSYKKTEYILKPNRGRDISALLVTAKDIIPQHEIVCFVHDKKSKHLHPLTTQDFVYHCMECCLSSPAYVEHVIRCLDENDRCGLLVPPTVYFACFFTLGRENALNEGGLAEVYDLLKLSCPMDDTVVAPFGTCFWAKSKALKALYRKEWKIEDFPDEPMPTDSTISHAIERIIPIAVQDEGYYSAWCSPDFYASLYMNNFSLMLREYNRRLYARYGVLDWNFMLSAMDADAQAAVCPDMPAERKKLRRKRRKYRIINLLSLGITYRRNKKKLRKYKERHGLA